jgi:hypothetical protein
MVVIVTLRAAGAPPAAERAATSGQPLKAVLIWASRFAVSSRFPPRSPDRAATRPARTPVSGRRMKAANWQKKPMKQRSRPSRTNVRNGAPLSRIRRGSHGDPRKNRQRPHLAQRRHRRAAGSGCFLCWDAVSNKEGADRASSSLPLGATSASVMRLGMRCEGRSKQMGLRSLLLGSRNARFSWDGSCYLGLARQRFSSSVRLSGFLWMTQRLPMHISGASII